MVGCTTTGQAYLPHTSRIFHAKKNCVGCYDPNPIVFPSIQSAANSSGIVPCSMCVKAQGVSQGYPVQSYTTPIYTPSSSSSGLQSFSPASSDLYEPKSTTGTYIGNLSSNPYAPNSTANQYGAGSPYNPNSVNNPYGTYGSPYSPKSANNPYTTDAPKLYDSKGQYKGKLSSNPYDPDSTSNPYGKYGSPYSPDSINNPYGAGNPYSPNSPNNPYGSGFKIIGQ